MASRSPLRFLLTVSVALLAIAGVLGWLLPAVLSEALPWLSIVGAAVVLASSFLVALSGRRLLNQTDRATAAAEAAAMGDWLPYPSPVGAAAIGAGADALPRRETETGFIRRVAGEVARATRHEAPLALLIVAIDNADSAGKASAPIAAERLQATVGEIVRNSIRTSDASGRIADGRIAVILAETDLEGASRAAEKLRRHVEVYPFDLPHAMTVSIGVAAHVNGSSPHDLVEAANVACTSAQEDGGNSVREAPHSG